MEFYAFFHTLYKPRKAIFQYQPGYFITQIGKKPASQTTIFIKVLTKITKNNTAPKEFFRGFNRKKKQGRLQEEKNKIVTGPWHRNR